MRNVTRALMHWFLRGVLLAPSVCAAIDVPVTTTALHLRNIITGGTMPVNDPAFAQMVTHITNGDSFQAAMTAADTPYFAKYLARRLALQMQTPTLDESGITDSDATTFLIAHFTGSATRARLSTIWSENATYLVKDPDAEEFVHAADLNNNKLARVDWTQLKRLGGQQDVNGNYIPVEHVGGYTTLSDRENDNSFALYGATAGTNLRFIVGIWQIATGLSLMDVASSSATPREVPRFVPIYDVNFFQGQGQTACIACHGGGMTSLSKGYATVANIFDVRGNGFTYIPRPTTNSMKSLGSEDGERMRVLSCYLTQNPTPVCNPESPDVDPHQGWDVSQSWEKNGVLMRMGWQGPLRGNGLQTLGHAIGQSWIMYQFFTHRVIQELCPLGTFTANEINQIAEEANPYADPAGTDDLRTIVARVASSPGCQ